MIKRWLDTQGFLTKKGYMMSLSRIYATLNNPFYYGEFKYGVKWYKGPYEPLISKHMFLKVQTQLETVPKSWNKQKFPFKKIAMCGSCGAKITAK